jgi:hypothetical protein
VVFHGRWAGPQAGLGIKTTTSNTGENHETRHWSRPTFRVHPALLMTPMGAVTAHDTPLPLGDGNISSSPVRGQVFSCQTNFRRAGVVKNQPWIRGDNWYPAEKVTVEGAMSWPNSKLSITVEGQGRVIRANSLPSHATGRFPIDRSSAAYRHDRNPNGINEQAVLLRLPANPRAAAAPACLPMGPIRFALTGVAIYNALDAAGLDAAAHEVQDKCSGHPRCGANTTIMIIHTA